VPAAARRISVVSQRGTNGIDGIVSGAAGTSVAVGRPTLLLVGDVSFVHDLGGLAAVRLAKAPLAIVVIDNDGGRIFDELPVARLFGSHPKRAELWLTPPGLSLSHAAGLFGLPYVAPQSVPELRTAAESALERLGATIIHVRVLPHSARDTARDVRNGLDAPLADLAQTFRSREPEP
jgi:2-succinyl-5-enolpyruvyl-6-hydroxy-3-cyclohexene-1-carboxylate synthase